MRKVIKNCSGCAACYNACPKNCIKMNADSEGFLYPEIDRSVCIKCGRCEAVCPRRNEQVGRKGKAYACINKNEAVRMKSSSGGIFTLFAEHVLLIGGVVFGAAFDDELNVVCTEIRNKDNLYRLRGSKYLQSQIGDSYKKAKAYLEKGKTVLFSGTPCQISGLKNYLGKEYDNLYMQDIICHGVPSPTVWQKYLEYLEKKQKSKVDKKNLPTFRSKQTGWTGYSVNINFENGKTFQNAAAENLYMRAFLNDLCLRPSCYECMSKSLERESDITLADFWGIEKLLPDMHDDKGTSLAFVNTQKGKRLFDAVKDKMVYCETDIDEAVRYNSAAYKSVEKNKNRDKFMEEIKSAEFGKLIAKYTSRPFGERLLSKIKNIIKRMCR